MTPVRIAEAIATFERTLYSDQTPFDLSVQQITPLGAAETRGQGIFNTRGCNVCHAGSLFSDNAFHNIGVRPQTEDTGRFQVTGNTNNIGEFRTPSLRNVGLRGPYFHNGRLAALEDVVAFYNRGGDFDAPNINHNLIRPLGLSPQQQSDLVAPMRFGNVLVDPDTRTVRKGDRAVALTAMEFNLLLALLERDGAVVSRVELLREVWGHAASVLTRTVDTHVAELRRKLEDDAAKPQHILTIRKTGYRLSRDSE